jgi:hypothetical protein
MTVAQAKALLFAVPSTNALCACTSSDKRWSVSDSIVDAADVRWLDVRMRKQLPLVGISLLPIESARDFE